MNKEQALSLLKRYISKDAMIKHSLASYAVMKAVAEKLGQDAELWAATGLLHDIDSELTQNDMKAHGLKARELLEGSLPEEAIIAIETHNEHASSRPRQTLFEHALSACETITGLITAVALVYPDKKLASVKVKSITKRMKEKSFAASVSRAAIMECEKLGLSLEDFTSVALNAMQGVAEELGL